MPKEKWDWFQTNLNKDEIADKQSNEQTQECEFEPRVCRGQMKKWIWKCNRNRNRGITYPNMSDEMVWDYPHKPRFNTPSVPSPTTTQ